MADHFRNSLVNLTGLPGPDAFYHLPYSVPISPFDAITFSMFPITIQDDVSTSSSSDSNPFKIIEPSLPQDFGRIRTDEHYSDMTISVKEKNYPVHKVVLAARSPVFDAMLKSNMQESQENHIVIKDINEDVFEEMLRYIYSGKADKLEELAFELLPVADKYDLKDLKTMCEEVLYKKLAPENVRDILILADMHNAEKLKKLTIQYIKRKNPIHQDFKNSEIYKVLKKSHPGLMTDVLTAFLEH